ncbi:MAG: PQQ-dependent sugar dehydrogenase [Myxococcota bacterium]
MLRRQLSSASLLLALSACFTTGSPDTGPSPAPDAATTAHHDGGTHDAARADAGGNADASSGADAARPDAGRRDAGVPDAAPRPDAAAPFGLDTRPANPTCVAPARPTGGAQVNLTRAFPDLTFEQPLLLLQAPGDASRFFVVEKAGRVKVFNAANPTTATVWLDITERVNDHGEGGLLGMAFHPDFAFNGEVYLSYTTDGTGQQGVSVFISRLSRFTSPDNGVTLDANSEDIVLTVTQPWDNHNGGHVAFGPDGYLYLGFGDGGSGGDPLDHAQNINTLLGAMIRIDVDSGEPYAIPPDNPFALGGGAPEIYAWGLRNPWRWSFDRVTGDLWVGDVGQNAYEEIDIIELGGNYGWNRKEGFHCYSTNPCEGQGWIDPVVEYPHSEGNSVTGGYVYRGTEIPDLDGVYIYADFGRGTVWGLFYDAISGAAQPQVLVNSGVNVASFSEDLAGELYLLAYHGAIYKFTPGATTDDNFPDRLSETGCVRADNPREPAPGVLPYSINLPFWSDGAGKARYLAIPDNTTLDVDVEGHVVFPIGSVLMKTFEVDGEFVEVRLLVRHDDGEWAGYSYEWDSTLNDGVLLSGSKFKQVGSTNWTYPSRADCLFCHNSAAGRSLGPELAQLNTRTYYPSTNRFSNTLATLEHVGMLTQPLPGAPETLPRFHQPNDTSVSVRERARAYLHVNCGYCHRPSGPGQGVVNFQYSVPDESVGVCNAEPSEGNLGTDGGRLMIPGDPEHSIMYLRLSRRDAYAMPPIGTRIVDEEGAALISQWIEQQSVCP